MVPIFIAMVIASIVAMAITYFQTREFGEPMARGQYVALAVIPIFFLGAITPASYFIGLHASQQGAVSGYSQFLNGSIVAANVETTNCSRDGSCQHSYECDSYSVTVQDVSYDSKGKAHYSSHQETRWHDCPYVTQEFSYTLDDSLGDSHTIASHVFATTPVAWKDPYSFWGGTKAIPGDVNRGVPAQWQHAADGIKLGNLDPVTVPNTYKNYILSSEKTLLKDSSDEIDALKSKNLLPNHTVNLQKPIYDNFIADKINFVGVSPTPSVASTWRSALMHFNAALGMTRQGDLHVIAVKASAVAKVTSPDGYLNAVKAHWLNDLGKKALAKNGVIVVLAVDDSASTIKWSRSSTGMPIGNGAMIQALNLELTGTPFTPANVFGSTTASTTTVNGKLTAKYSVGTGIVAHIILQKYPFERACMGCSGAEDAGQTGFTQLSTEIPLGGTALVWTIIIDVVLGLGIILGLYSFFGISDLNLKDTSSGADRYSGYAYSTYGDSGRSSSKRKK